MLQVTCGGAGGAEPGRAAAAACQVSPPQASSEPSSQCGPDPQASGFISAGSDLSQSPVQSLGPGGPTLGMGPWRLLIMFPIFHVPYERSDHPACLQQESCQDGLARTPAPIPRGWMFSLRIVPPPDHPLPHHPAPWLQISTFPRGRWRGAQALSPAAKPRQGSLQLSPGHK